MDGQSYFASLIGVRSRCPKKCPYLIIFYPILCCPILSYMVGFYTIHPKAVPSNSASLLQLWNPPLLQPTYDDKQNTNSTNNGQQTTGLPVITWQPIVLAPIVLSSGVITRDLVAWSVNTPNYNHLYVVYNIRGTINVILMVLQTFFKQHCIICTQRLAKEIDTNVNSQTPRTTYITRYFMMVELQGLCITHLPYLLSLWIVLNEVLRELIVMSSSNCIVM